ncbi:SH3 domain containing protein, partial [Entamoeba invadens IP1]
RDLYNYLKTEIIDDVNKLTSSSDEVVSPIAGTLLVSYTDYLNLINENWGLNSQAAGNFKVCAVDPTTVITPGESSMVIDANVFSKKSGDVSSGTYEPSEFEKSPQTSTPMQSSVPKSANGTPQRRAAPPPPQRGGPKKERVRCGFDYTAQEQGELTFKEGDIITVMKKEGDWWMGELNGVQGYFPSNYVSPA